MPMAAELDWTYGIGDIPESGLSAERRATPAACAGIAAALDLVACNRLEARYEIKPLSQGRYLLEGSLEADITQSCVVTLEPVESHLLEPFEVEFRPGAPTGVAEFDALEARDIEPLEGGVIPVGRIVYEHLASAIEPYPRKEGAVLDQQVSGRREAEEGTSPFAVLKQLRPKAETRPKHPDKE